MYISVVHCGSSHKLTASSIVWLQLIVLVALKGHWDRVFHVSLCEHQMLQYLEKEILCVFIFTSQSLTHAHMLSFCATQHHLDKPISHSLSLSSPRAQSVPASLHPLDLSYTSLRIHSIHYYTLALSAMAGKKEKKR